MITIDQLLESVDLDFEPRWVTKDEINGVRIWDYKPDRNEHGWLIDRVSRVVDYPYLKLSEFEGKDWTECIYEVPRKEEFKDKIKIGTLYIDKSVTFGDGDDDDVGVALEDYEVPRKTTREIEKLREVSIIRDGDFPSIESTVKVLNRIINRLNELVDAVNELKGANQ